jgi:hypothetical protein
MFMTSAETTTAVFCDLETYLCPRTVLVERFVNSYEVIVAYVGIAF